MSAPPPASPFDPALAETGRVPTLAVLVSLFGLTILPFVAGLI